MLLAAAEAATRGWGGPFALLAAGVAFWAGVEARAWIRAKIDNHSPTPPTRPDTGVSSQVRSVSDTDDTDGDTDHWAGRIVEAGGRRVRQFGHIWRTGDSLPDGDIDDDREPEGIEEFVSRLDSAGGMTYTQIVRAAMDTYQVSEATAKRAIRRSRGPA